jgi:hypothetical protein
MKTYLTHRPHYDVDYCKYTDWGYQKRTRIWTNLKGFIPKTCKKDCGNIEDNKHRTNFGGNKTVRDGDKIIKVKSTELRKKYKDFENIQINPKGGGSTKSERYRIPPLLIKELFELI